MPGVPFTERSTIVQVLTGIALVLFCLIFLRFVTLTFAHDAPRQMTTTVFDGEALGDPEVREAERELDWYLHRYERVQSELQRRRCGNDDRYVRLIEIQQAMQQSRLRLQRLQEQRQREATVQQELQLRALQNPEVDETLRDRLRLSMEATQVPIMR